MMSCVCCGKPASCVDSQGFEYCREHFREIVDFIPTEELIEEFMSLCLSLDRSPSAPSRI